MEVILNDDEKILLAYMKEHNDSISSSKARELLNIPYVIEHGKIVKWERVITKKRTPNLYGITESYMTANSHGMYRGGFAWFSEIGIKLGKESDYKNLLLLL